jgi:hypothetical protein
LRNHHAVAVTLVKLINKGVVMKWYTAIVPFLLLSSTAYSQQPKNASYDCVMEWAGGGKYNSVTKLWEGTGFDANSMEPQFTLRVTYLGRDATKSAMPAPFQIDDYYNITITTARWGMPIECSKDGSNNVYVIRNVSDGSIAFECTSWSNVGILRPYQYHFNLRSNRFLRIYAGRYLPGNDNREGSDPPYIAGGTCTKVE